MAILPPKPHTYHCICTSLLLTTTHTLSSLPRRTANTGGLDSAIIVPLPSSPPILSPSPSPSSPNSPSDDNNQEASTNTDTETSKITSTSTRQNERQSILPPAGYSLLLDLHPDRNTTIVRREDGFEKRVLWRCGRCRVVVGYEISSSASGLGTGDEMDVDEEGEGEYEGRIMYLLPGGILSTDVMMKGGVMSGGRKMGEEDVNVGAGIVAVFE